MRCPVGDKDLVETAGEVVSLTKVISTRREESLTFTTQGHTSSSREFRAAEGQP